MRNHTPSPPEHSLQDLTRHRTDVGSEIEARLYLYNQRFIVSSVAAIAEHGPVTTIPFDAPDREIGLAACSHLVRFVPDLPPGLRDQTSKDWQAYQASGARSVKQFNAGAWRVSISTLNMALRLEAQPVSVQVAFLFAGSEIGLSTRHAGIGAAIRRVLKAAATLNENGLFDETA
jgi:hypothetical protein